jgi:hypothetical protein
MKKYIFLLTIFAALCMTVAAQDATVQRLGSNFEVTLDAGDTISDNSTTLSKTIGLGAKPAVQLYSIQVSLDSISGTPAQSWVLAGSMDNINWTTISTVTYIGSESDKGSYGPM